MSLDVICNSLTGMASPMATISPATGVVGRVISADPAVVEVVSPGWVVAVGSAVAVGSVEVVVVVATAAGLASGANSPKEYADGDQDRGDRHPTSQGFAWPPPRYGLAPVARPEAKPSCVWKRGNASSTVSPVGGSGRRGLSVHAFFESPGHRQVHRW